MPAFVHPALLWGLALVGVPLLIHLINMLRHRRVRWAAMEFLLESQQRNRRWIMLRQLLLLLLRMLAIAAVVLILAQPMLSSGWGAMFGGSRTHHIVLLDDSFSMSERRGDTTAFDRAKAAISRLGSDLARRGVPQTFTLLRYSKSGGPGRGAEPDLLEVIVGGDFPQRLDETLEGLVPSQLASTTLPALEAADRISTPDDATRRVLYVVSDFRAHNWSEPEELRTRLGELSDSGTRLNFVACAEVPQPNVGITGLSPKPSTLAAGVPIEIEVTVRNFSGETASNVAVKLEEDGTARPGFVIEEIAGGRSETRRFPVLFPTAGPHRVVARLDDDALPPDNSRYAVVNVPLDERVLLVDGDPSGKDARFLATALAPGGSVRTGLSPLVETPRFLAEEPLDGFQTIYLTNVAHLERAAVDALEKFVQRGGGLALFVGPPSNAATVNEGLYRDGKGLLPAPLAEPRELLVDRLEKAPDLQVTEHPIFKIFAGERNSFLGTVGIERYVAIPDLWQPADHPGVRVIARLRNHAPLVLERKFGEGQVVLFLTTAAPVWNNWGRNPSFVVTLLELQTFLGGEQHREPPRLVGTPLVLDLEPSVYDPRVRFSVPGVASDGAVSTDGVLKNGRLDVTLPDTDIAGVYAAELVTTAGDSERREFAFNVFSDEGQLALLDGQQLAAALTGIPFDYHRAEGFQFSARELAGFNLSDGLLYLLVALLIGEQALAYAASYHPSPPRGKR
ncbi:MAG: BatA domain-containing protein [Pirellulales bacterium]|nr:BatA domain-containing protein [Pirellulales bacterium]